METIGKEVKDFMDDPQARVDHPKTFELQSSEVALTVILKKMFLDNCEGIHI